MTTKFWCFTQNDNPNSFHAALGDFYARNTDKIGYICGQLEVASTGQRHFQGYLQLKYSRNLGYVRNNISDTAHWEISRGTSTQARDYCNKADETTVPATFVEFGDFKVTRGRRRDRTDILTMRDKIMDGVNQREIIEDDELVGTFVKYMRGHDRIRSLYPPKRDREDDFKVSLYFGDPRTGKTRKAKEEYPGLYEVPITTQTIWFDGYDGHEVVLFDDFAGRASKITLDSTLKLFDRYVRQVPIKGAHTWYNPSHVIVTSNLHPRYWFEWKNREEHWSALWQRFTEVIVFHEGEEPEVQDSVEEFMLDRDLWPSEQPTIGGDGVTYFN